MQISKGGGSLLLADCENDLNISGVDGLRKASCRIRDDIFLFMKGFNL